MKIGTKILAGVYEYELVEPPTGVGLYALKDSDGCTHTYIGYNEKFFEERVEEGAWKIISEPSPIPEKWAVKRTKENYKVLIQ